ncbi:MATE efflux family protein isoform 1 [Theobroma cacao]|uniref:MATE efflux family protein isoform 1 n=1 Tax=Theobroma cacao TaxID=3641 RepID=A0A061EP16_THECC|nr:MATE efflux family protein isoform 1 [Theobroma cacao]
MVCLEWWSFELLVLLSGLLPISELETSVLSICLATTSLHYFIPYGVGAAASTRVSNELGARNPQAARVAVNVEMVLGVSEALIVSISVARGTGWQHIGAYVNLGAYYLVGIPVAALLCFGVHFRGKRLWIGKNRQPRHRRE